MTKKKTAAAAIILAILAFGIGRYTSQSVPSAQAGKKHILYYVDPMHPSYRSDKPGIAPDCGMPLEPVYEDQAPAPTASLPAGAVAISPERQQLYGIRIATAQKRSGSHVVRTTGRVQAEDNRIYRLMAATDGWIQSLEDNPVGTVVKKDQLLATYYSKEFRNAEQAYLASLVSLDRLRPGHSIDDTLKMNDANLRINEEQLRSLGMSESQIKELAKTRLNTSDITINSPVDGVVLSRDISPLQKFENGAEFYRIGDLSKVWITADIFGDEGELFRSGTKVRLNLREVEESISATVGENPPYFDAATGTLKLRLEADNPGLILRPDMYVDLEFNVSSAIGISLPQEAVLDTGLGKTVYVESSPGVFEPRAIKLGVPVGDRVVVSSGITEGERFVASGNFLVDSESRLRGAALEAGGTAAKSHAAGNAEENATKDPVCGMALSSTQAHSSQHVESYHGDTFHFCSDDCQKKFHREPARYARSNDDAKNTLSESPKEARR